MHDKDEKLWRTQINAYAYRMNKWIYYYKLFIILPPPPGNEKESLCDTVKELESWLAALPLSVICLFIYVLMELGIELCASHVLGKHSTDELYPQYLFLVSRPEFNIITLITGL